jgi:ketosteroid isomerase-like protein
MGSNLDLVRALHADYWERGDFFDHADWAHPEIECVMVDGPTPGSGTGLAGMARLWRDVIGDYDQFSITAEEYREVDERRVLVLVRFRGRGRASGLELGDVSARNASVLEIEGGLVRRLTLYWDRERAFADLDIQE